MCNDIHSVKPELELKIVLLLYRPAWPAACSSPHLRPAKQVRYAVQFVKRYFVSLVVKTSSGKTKTKTGPCETKTKNGPCETKTKTETSVGETKTETKTRTITSSHQL